MGTRLGNPLTSGSSADNEPWLQAFVLGHGAVLVRASHEVVPWAAAPWCKGVIRISDGTWLITLQWKTPRDELATCRKLRSIVEAQRSPLITSAMAS